MTTLAHTQGLDIVVGFAQWTDGKKYNYALTFLASGGEPVRYLKHHDMVSPPGRDLTLLRSAGVLICADVNHRNPSSDYATAGAQLLAIPASDEDDKRLAAHWFAWLCVAAAVAGLARARSATPSGELR